MTIIPKSLKREHDDLHEDLVKATQAGGETATAAKKVAHLLHPHFVQEEAFAMPPLGALAALARGETPSDAASILAMTQRLRMELPRMLAEHQAIVGALRELATAARAEGNPGVAAFADRLVMHARNEEDVLYPAAILVGDILKARGIS